MEVKLTPAEMKTRWKEENQMGSFEKKLTRLLELARDRAKKRGFEFSISAEDFIPTQFCPLLGIPFDFSKRGKGAADNSPTIDRIDSSKGYVPGNVWVISHRANRMKSDATIQELEMIVINIKAKLGT